MDQFEFGGSTGASRAMQEILGRLQFLGYNTQMVGMELHVSAHGVALIVTEDGDRYMVRAASGNEIARVCNGADEVLSEVRNWRG